MQPNPKTIGKYQIVATLGKGSMGVVYKGLDPMIGRFVAIKTIHPEVDGFEEQEIKQRFRREAQAAGRMNHANIVSVYEYGEDESGAFIAMEFVEGKTLAQALAEGRRFDLETTVNIMLGLLSALDYSHKVGVVHRDIKPANIMLTGEGEVKVADFGIAGLESSTLTRTGIMMGTPSYMAPEQLLGHKVDGRADIFSAGSVFYQLLTGERPFQGALASVMHQVTAVNPESPSMRNSEVPPGFDAVAAKAMAKRPDDRYQNAAAFRDAIKAVFYNVAETRRLPASTDTAVAAASADETVMYVAETPAQVPAQAPAPAPLPEPGEATVTVFHAQHDDRPEEAAVARRWPLIGGAVGGLLAIVAAVLLAIKKEGPKPAPVRPESKVEVEPARTPPVATVVPPPREAVPEANKPVPLRKEEGVASRKPGETLKDCAACPELIVIAPGQFTNGGVDAERGGKAADASRQLVSIDYYYAMGRYEVTRSQFAAFVAETGHQAKGCWTYDGQWTYREDLDWRSPGYEQQDQHPVTCVSWLDAQAYTSWLGKKTGQTYRLPSSTEWQNASGAEPERAARMADKREICKWANVADLSAEQHYAGWSVHECRDGFIHTAPVGRFQPNSRGVHDMLGNLFEWVEDCWAESLRGAPADGAPMLQGDCKQRVLHGGSWFTIPKYVEPGFRNHFQASYRASSLGFRVVRNVKG